MEYTHRVQVFGMPWQGRRRFSIAHPSIPSRWEGKSIGCPMTYSPHVGRGRSIGCPMTYSPSRREGRGVGDPIRPPSVPAPIFCTRWVDMRSVGAMEAVGREARTCRLPWRSHSIRGIVRHGSAVSHHKRWEMERRDAGHSVPSKKSEPGRCSTRSPERTETARLRPPS